LSARGLPAKARVCWRSTMPAVMSHTQAAI
jgi:hypothetical protein